MALENIDKKRLFLIVGLIVILISAIVLIKVFWKKTPAYSENPKDWLDTTDEYIGINTSRATNKVSYLNYIGQQYIDTKIQTVFSHDGIYKGNYFKDEYIEENTTIAKIRFTDNLKQDGVPEGYIFETLKDTKPIVHIFLDEDWKTQIEFTNIIWGKDYQNIKEFTFKELEPGIYYDTIEDDVNRFRYDYSFHMGGILVGRITKEELEGRKRGLPLSNAIALRVI